MDEISGVIYFYESTTDFLWSVKVDGTSLTKYTSAPLSPMFPSPPFGLATLASARGKYICILNVNSNPPVLSIFKNGAVLQTVTLSSMQLEEYISGAVVVISPSLYASRTGQYIVVIGTDATTDTLIRIQVYEGQP